MTDHEDCAAVSFPLGGEDHEDSITCPSDDPNLIGAMFYAFVLGWQLSAGKETYTSNELLRLTEAVGLVYCRACLKEWLARQSVSCCLSHALIHNVQTNHAIQDLTK